MKKILSVACMASLAMSAMLSSCGNKEKAAEEAAATEAAENSELVWSPTETMNVADLNAKTGEEFLAENAKRPEVKTTPSGLQYEVLTEGTGAQPTATDQVVVHYTGKLIDGTVFDSSVDRGEPATFGVTQVIPGWVEALQMMKAGSAWRLYIPSDLAYGPRGAGGVIGPNETLIFDVTLLEVVGK